MAVPFLTMEGVSVRIGGSLLLDNLDWVIRRGEQWAIVGPSGSGKTLLAFTLLGRFYSSGRITGPKKIAIVEQQHRFGGNPPSTQLYYQQRFNASDADQTITVQEELAQYAPPGPKSSDAFQNPGDPGPSHWLDDLHIRPLLNKPLIQLSNGENKRVQLAIALSGEPDLLILDNPFLGLDIEGRKTLHTIIDNLAAGGMQLLLITSPRELPSSITHITMLSQGKWVFQGPRVGFHSEEKKDEAPPLDPGILASLQEQAFSDKDPFEIAVRLVNTTIRYGEATILKNINWEVKRGDKWNVSGPNGAGKSTILSLITADNPQAYANEVWLFDRRRGTGETIWEIKKKIGFVSPELHLYFDSSVPCFDVIASGLFDTIGLFRQLTPEQEAITGRWIELLSLRELRHRRLTQLSTGQQRMVLLARALIKNPPLLILDEPCQGLDEEQTSRFRNIISSLCKAFDTTLIYVSHYRQELPDCIDKFLQLEKGEIVGMA